MFWLLTVGSVALGGALGWLGIRRAIRRRLEPIPPARPDRLMWVLCGAAVFLLLAPDLIPAQVAAGPGLVGWLGLWVWRGFAVVGIGAVTMIGLVTSRPSVDKVRRTAAAAAVKVPSWTRWRRRSDPRLKDFPTTWEGLLEYDRSLSRELVSYQHDLEKLANRPAMLDYTDAHTRAAIEAMTMCDRHRREIGPITRDVTTTDYGQAVARFAVALREAEENADRQVRSGLGADERSRLTEAARIIAFVQDNATTGADRQRAYQRVTDQLSLDVAADEDTRQHPWLDVHERADVNRPA